ncbi:hypothetical protein H9P43_004984 [Blastocladiella emersonii ATCC 22665]|nr:hypothetical protein H9P43_004984 [Blastocladiella emersonii ATCC 22665]
MSFPGVPPLPEDAKPILPFVLRAQEMASRDVGISYWCKMHAARLALQLSSAIPNIRGWLIALMDHLEQEKKANADNEFIHNEMVAAAHIENFALKIFAAADREDRAGKASMRTAKTFMAASHYFEVLGSLKDELDDATRDKIKYAKWKAADITKAIKNGETPRPGPPGEETDENAAAAAQDQQFPGAPIPPSSPYVQAPPPAASSPFAQAPPPPAAGGYASFPPPQPQPGYDPLNLPTPPSVPPRRSSANGNTAPPLQFDPPPAAYASPTAPPAPASGGGGSWSMPNPQVTSQVQKHARFVISALEYDDVATAMENLRRAMALLAPYEK